MSYETDFGNIAVREREMLLIPKGVTYRVLMKKPEESFRIIYESVPEVFLVPAEMIETYYRMGRPALTLPSFNGRNCVRDSRGGPIHSHLSRRPVLLRRCDHQ
jgi:hypothetical protein